MSTRRSRTNTRDDLLQAAERVVLRDGAPHLTLDAVAREAGLSKGGVLYHFSTKDALVAAMLANIAARYTRDLTARAAAEGDQPGAWMRAYVLSAFEDDESDDVLSSANGGLLAAVATNPALLDPLRAEFGAWQARLEADGVDLGLTTLVRLAVDGLWLIDLLGLGPPSDAARARLEILLRQLVEDETGGR